MENWKSSLRKCSLENDYNHVGYYILYTWNGFWDIPDKYNDDERWNTECIETKFFLNNCYVESCEEPIKEFMSYISKDTKTIYHSHTAELWFVEKDLNKIKAHKVAEYFSPSYLDETAVIKDAVEYDKKNPHYSFV